MAGVFATLHHDSAALGTRLFTITTMDEAARVYRRAYTSHPLEYPVSGTKPVEKDGWYAFCIAGFQPFVANTPPEFAKYFFDHALITSLGLGSCLNIPIRSGTGPVLGTVNLLAEDGHFTKARLDAYLTLTAAATPALAAALPATLSE